MAIAAAESDSPNSDGKNNYFIFKNYNLDWVNKYIIAFCLNFFAIIPLKIILRILSYSWAYK